MSEEVIKIETIEDIQSATKRALVEYIEFHKLEIDTTLLAKDLKAVLTSQLFEEAPTVVEAGVGEKDEEDFGDVWESFENPAPPEVGEDQKFSVKDAVESVQKSLAEAKDEEVKTAFEKTANERRRRRLLGFRG